MDFDVYYLVDHSMWFMLCAFVLVFGAFYVRRIGTLFDRFTRKKGETRKIVY